MSNDDTRNMEHASADVTVPLSPKELWRPASKLTARVEPARLNARPDQRRDPRLLAAAILITAAAIAVALWMTALWLRASDDSNSGPPDQSTAMVITLNHMTGGLQGGSYA